MANLAYECFVSAKGLIRNLADQRPLQISGKVSDESLGRNETYVCKASHNYPL